MFDGKLKALTFTFDDGVVEDLRFVELINKYNIKCTFNLNSNLFGTRHDFTWHEFFIPHLRLTQKEINGLYNGHEIAAHTLNHPNLTELSKEEIIKEVEEDRINLSKIFGYEIVGFAYPCGGVNNDERVAKIIKENTGVKYARTIDFTYDFEMPTNLYRFHPTLSHNDYDNLFRLAEDFVNLKPESPKLFSIMGHSYELNMRDTWDKLEEFLKIVSNRDDIFYGTNKQILLGEK
jgi:peptidoglycan/xylan/chitin deacetylase (PgdA/CDA1 family)